MIEMSESVYDESIVEINPNQQEVAVKGIVEAIESLKYLYERVRDKDLTVCMRNANLGLAGSLLDRIGKALGHEQDIERDLKADHSNIRQLNEQLTSLRNQLSEGAIEFSMGPYLRKLERCFYTFWNRLGFLTVKDAKFVPRWDGSVFMEAECSLFMDKHSSLFSETPVDDRLSYEELIENMRADGVHLNKSAHNESPSFTDDSFNKAWLVGKIRELFPNAKITNWASYASDHINVWNLRCANVLIPLGDLSAYYNSLSFEEKEKL